MPTRVCNTLSARANSPVRWISVGWFVAVSLLVLAEWTAVRADVVIFKDGFTLVGTIKQEKTMIYDSASGFQASVAKNLSFFVDDGARKIIFSYKIVKEPEKKNLEKGTEPTWFQRRMVPASNWRLPPGQYEGITPFDAKWNRIASLNTRDGRSANGLPIFEPRKASSPRSVGRLKSMIRQ